jgi:exonuclease III
LTLLQWNCDHLLAKIPELEDLLREKEVDIVLLQETKLRGEDRFSGFSDFNVIRKDRRRENMSRYARGGGLVTLVRKGLPFQSLPVVSLTDKDDASTEMMAVQVFTGEQKWVKILNVYCPPTSSQGSNAEAVERTISRLPLGRDWVVGGDWNGHHDLWDNQVPRDARGNRLAAQVEDGRQIVLNDNNVTRQERGTDRKSTPDVTFCHESMADRTRWQVCRGWDLTTGRFSLSWQTRWPSRSPKLSWCGAGSKRIGPGIEMR